LEETDHFPREQRRKLLLGAFIEHSSGIYPAQVRDVARGGALLISDAPVQAGEQITIRRKSLDVSAVVVWRRADRLGVRFDADFELSTWVPELESQVVTAAFTSGVLADLDDELSLEVILGRISEEMRAVARAVELTSEEISEDRIGLLRFDQQIQRLSSVTGELEELAKLISGGDLASNIWKVKIENLRRRLTR
jgi:hypothetical protein